MDSINHEILWGMLLQLRNKVRNHAGDLTNASILWYGPHFEIYLNSIPEFTSDVKAIIFSREPVLDYPGIISFLLDDNYNIKLYNNQFLSFSQTDFLLLYLPLCFGATKAHSLKRAVTVLHLAQSLDGRIATKTGHSMISNQEDIVHIHRIRALSDAVLIGAKTLEIDKPALNVQYVKGPNPVKIVVGNSKSGFESLLGYPGKVLYFTCRQDIAQEGVEPVFFPSEDNKISPKQMLEELYRRKLYSICIGGGAHTASAFLAEQSVDILQLFLVPKIFGAGICNFILPPISYCSESIEFINPSFRPMGNGVLFEGAVAY